MESIKFKRDGWTFKIWAASLTEEFARVVLISADEGDVEEGAMEAASYSRMLKDEDIETCSSALTVLNVHAKEIIAANQED